jgi:hypothetical protein
MWSFLDLGVDETGMYLAYSYKIIRNCQHLAKCSPGEQIGSLDKLGEGQEPCHKKFLSKKTRYQLANLIGRCYDRRRRITAKVTHLHGEYI